MNELPDSALVERRGALRLTIVVGSYNYAQYLDDSIGSALAVRWPDKEVIVVDDGSTDDSRSVIESYGDRIIAIYKQNGGLNSSANLAFERCSGDIIMFLDADDTLDAGVAEAVAAKWRDNVVAVQFGQYKVNERGERIGAAWPVYTERHTPHWVRSMVERTGYYEGPPTSASAWSRGFLKQVFPLPTRRPGDTARWGLWFDDYLNTLAPFFGDVVCLAVPQGSYRIHGSNAHGGRGFSPEYVAELCTYDTARTQAVNAVLAKLPGRPQIDIERQADHMKHRLIYRRLLTQQYGYGDSIGAVYRKFWRAILLSETSGKAKTMMLLWGAVVAFAPQRLAFRAAQAKQELASRPKLLRLIWKW